MKVFERGEKPANFVPVVGSSTHGTKVASFPTIPSR